MMSIQAQSSGLEIKHESLTPPGMNSAYSDPACSPTPTSGSSSTRRTAGVLPAPDPRLGLICLSGVTWEEAMAPPDHKGVGKWTGLRQGEAFLIKLSKAMLKENPKHMGRHPCWLVTSLCHHRLPWAAHTMRI